MSGYVFDPFQSMAVGAPGPPPGWSFSFGNGIVRAGGDGPGPYPPHNWYDIDTTGLFTPQFPGTGQAVGNLTCFFSLEIEHGGPTGTIFQLYGPPASGSTPVPLASLVQENDMTLSVYCQGSLPLLCGNSGVIPLTIQSSFGGNYKWYYVQLNISITSTTILGTQWMTVTTTLVVDGQTLFSGSRVSDTVQIAALAAVGVNQVSWQGENLGIEETVLCDQLAPGSYPRGIWTVTVTAGGANYNPGTTTATLVGGTGSGAILSPVIDISTGAITAILVNAGGLGYTVTGAVVITDSSGLGSGASATAALAPSPFVRIPQAVAEIAIEPTTAHVRMNQGVVELAKRPSTANVRIPQMVIEIATLNQPGPWYVTES